MTTVGWVNDSSKNREKWWEMWVDDGRRVVRKERREKRIGGMRDTWRSKRYHNRRKYRKKIGGLGEHQNVNDSRENE